MRREKKHVSFGSLIDGFRAHCSGLKDTRQNGKLRYSLTDVVLSGFACMFFQDRSLLQFQRRMEEKGQSNVSSLFGVEKIPEDTQLRETLDGIPPESFRPFFKECFSRLQRGKHLEQFQMFGTSYLLSIDGTQYFSSQEISCNHCLTKDHKPTKESPEAVRTYCHQALQAAIVHPECKQVIPLIAEDIRNTDGMKKQDCEINAAKRLVTAVRKDHPQLGIVLLGDGLFSHNPMIEVVRALRMDFIFTAKPDDHKYMMEWINDYHEEDIGKLSRTEKKSTFVYRWVNDVPLSGDKDAFDVNYFQLEIFSPDENGELKRTFRSSWVTNLPLSAQNIEHMVRAARCRWKIENECFNNLKNQGYHLEHNYGHGAQFLSFNFYLLTLLAFLFHQIFELTDHLFQRARKRWSKFLLWEQLRTLMRLFIFRSWNQLLNHCLEPPELHSTAQF